MPSAGAKCFRLDGGGGGYIKGGTTFSVRQPGYNCDNASTEAPLHTPRCRGLKEEFSIFCYAERFQFLAFRSRSPLRLLIILAERDDKNRRPSLPPSSPIALRIKESMSTAIGIIQRFFSSIGIFQRADRRQREGGYQEQGQIDQLKLTLQNEWNSA